MYRRPPRSTRTANLFPYPTLVRSLASSRCRKVKIVVSSGIRSKPICAKRRCGAARECGGREQDSETWLDVIQAPSVPAITELEADDARLAIDRGTEVSERPLIAVGDPILLDGQIRAIELHVEAGAQNLAPAQTAVDRKRAVSGKSETVRVDLGGRRTLKKKTK